jgi:hypothetical protein
MQTVLISGRNHVNRKREIALAGGSPVVLIQIFVETRIFPTTFWKL